MSRAATQSKGKSQVRSHSESQSTWAAHARCDIKARSQGLAEAWRTRSNANAPPPAPSPPPTPTGSRPPSANLSVGTDQLTPNPFSYVNGNPLNATDPDGHRPWCGHDECTFNVNANGNFTNVKAATEAPWVPPEGYIADGAPLADFQSKDQFASWVYEGQAAELSAEDAVRRAYENWFTSFQGGAGSVDGYEDVELAYCQVFGQRCKSNATLWDIGQQMVKDTWNEITGCIGERNLSSCGALAVDAALYAIPFGLGKVAHGAKIADNLADAARTRAKMCSFAGSTTVLMADGSRKSIDEVEIADEVIATDPETGEQVAKRVEQIFVHADTVVDLVVESETITTTEDHPFWSVTDRRFERADELADGEKVLRADGRVVTVSGLTFGTKRESLAYNLAVEGIHTYHVGRNGILVHNTCADDLDGLAHVRDRHLPGGADVDDMSGLFDDGVDIAGLARGSAGTIGKYNPATGNIEYIVRSKSIIGTTGRDRLPTNAYTIVRNQYGELVTMHPGSP